MSKIFTTKNKCSVLKIAQLLLLLAFCKTGQSQLKVGMSPKAIMPSTVTANSSYSVIVWVKNKGTVNYTGKIHLKYGVDSTQTLSNIILTKTDSISVTNFAPGDSVLKSIGEVYSIQNAFRYGNGSTVVLWPYVKTDPTATKDSLKRIVYVLPLSTEVGELQYLNFLTVFPNPSNNGFINFNIDEGIELPKTIMFYSIDGSYITEIPYQKAIDISNLNSGIYILRLLSKDGVKSKTLKFIKD